MYMYVLLCICSYTQNTAIYGIYMYMYVLCICSDTQNTAIYSMYMYSSDQGELLINYTVSGLVVSTTCSHIVTVPMERKHSKMSTSSWLAYLLHFFSF